MRDEEKNKILLFCSLRRGIKESQRQRVLEEIITALGSVGVDNQSSSDV